VTVTTTPHGPRSRRVRCASSKAAAVARARPFLAGCLQNAGAAALHRVSCRTPPGYLAGRAASRRSDGMCARPDVAGHCANGRARTRALTRRRRRAGNAASDALARTRLADRAAHRAESWARAASCSTARIGRCAPDRELKHACVCTTWSLGVATPGAGGYADPSRPAVRRLDSFCLRAGHAARLQRSPGSGLTAIARGSNKLRPSRHGGGRGPRPTTGLPRKMRACRVWRMLSVPP